MSIYDFSYTSLEGKTVSMEKYRDQVILIVNTASKCGFTPQYEGLEKLYKEYGEQGLVVLGFPSGQFNDQEFDSADKIQEFCQLRYGVTFPLSEKVDVRGDEVIALFAYLTEKAGFKGLGKGIKAKGLATMLKLKYGEGYGDDQIKWNFTKFLVSRDGEVIGRYEPTVEPEAMEEDIKKLL